MLTLLILAVSAMLFMPDLKAEEVNAAALDSTANGIVARYVIAAATSEEILTQLTVKGLNTLRFRSWDRLPAYHQWRSRSNI